VYHARLVNRALLLALLALGAAACAHGAASTSTATAPAPIATSSAAPVPAPPATPPIDPLADLRAAAEALLAAQGEAAWRGWNANPSPFTWIATADEILAKVKVVEANVRKLVDNNA